MAGEPLKLGSAAGSRLVFERGSRITTTDSGIQSCAVSALCPDGANVFNFIPLAGANCNNVFGNSYLPATFKVDYAGGGADIEYLEGKAARVTINFKRPDPNRVTGRAGAKISVDSVINYQSPLNQNSLTFIAYAGGGSATSGLSSFGPLGFPEPVVLVKYNNNTRPNIGVGGLSQLYALPGSTNASGFPDTPSMFYNLSVPVQIGGSVTYYKASTGQFVTVGPLIILTTFNFQIEYRPNPLGWQLNRLKSDPIAGESFYDVQEEWRTTYFVYGTTLVSTSPPLPP